MAEIEYRFMYAEAPDGLTYKIEVSTQFHTMFDEQRLAVKYDYAENVWLKTMAKNGESVELRPAECNLPNCFCAAALRNVPTNQPSHSRG